MNKATADGDTAVQDDSKQGLVWHQHTVVRVLDHLHVDARWAELTR